MLRLFSVATVAFALLACSPTVYAQGVDPAEAAFWHSVSRSNNPAELQAYLDTYPQGRFAAIARERLQNTGRSSAPAEAPLEASIRPTDLSVRLTDGVKLDVNAGGLQRASNLRLVVVPAGSPDQVSDRAEFLLTSTPIEPTRLHLVIPSGPPGRDEVRLYFIPPFGSNFTVAARAPVTIGAGVPGAILSRDLAREAAQLGPVRFEASHRDRPVLVQAAFLRVRPRTEWNVAWFGGAPIGELSRKFVIMSIGQPNVAPDMFGSTGEAICALSTEDSASLNQIARLSIGDPVAVVGIPTSWDNATAADPVLLDQCALR